jgi:hypothetical protein
VQPHSSTEKPVLRIDIPPHALLRLTERGGNRQTVYTRVWEALRKYGPLSGCHVLDEYSPMLIVEFRPKRAVLTTALELGMALKPGTRTLHA